MPKQKLWRTDNAILKELFPFRDFCARQSDASTAQPLDKLMTRTNHSLTQHSRNQFQRVKHTFNEKQQNYGAYSPTFRKFSPPSDFFWKTVVKILATTWTRVAGGAVMPAKWRLHSKPRLRLRPAHDAPWNQSIKQLVMEWKMLFV